MPYAYYTYNGIIYGTLYNLLAIVFSRIKLKRCTIHVWTAFSESQNSSRLSVFKHQVVIYRPMPILDRKYSTVSLQRRILNISLHKGKLSDSHI